jgi:cytochrome b involved in lipid metabolism
MTMSEFLEQCKQGKQLTIIDKEILDCSSWIEAHPGGRDAIQKLVGRDATTEFHSIHGTNSVAKAMMKRLVIAGLNESDKKLKKD